MRTAFLTALCLMAVFVGSYFIWVTYTHIQDIALLVAFMSFLILGGPTYV